MPAQALVVAGPALCFAKVFQKIGRGIGQIAILPGSVIDTEAARNQVSDNAVLGLQASALPIHAGFDFRRTRLALSHDLLPVAALSILGDDLRQRSLTELPGADSHQAQSHSTGQGTA